MYGFVAARLSGVTKAPHVAFWSQDLAEPARLSKGQKIIFLLKKHFLKDCLLVVAPSRMRAEALKLFFGLRVDPYIVYNSPRFNMVMPKENWRHRLGIRHNTPLVIYGGGFGRDRYVPELVESVALWPKESFLVLAGYGQPEMIEELQNISRREGISDRVFIVGHLPSIFGLIQEAQVGVSFFNCGNHHDRNLYFRGLASNKIFEYLSLGKPSAVSHNEETAAFMDEFRCGVCVSDHSPHAIAEVITRLLTDGQALENLSRNALATHQRETYFENRFSILQRSLSRIIQARRPATHTSITQDSNNG
jgi:glycosyltransferase involved in cell wall biosynthesis